MSGSFFHVLVGGVQSGCGKTTFTLALLQWFQKNYSVQAFKAGPDYLDPLWHFAVTGQVSYNLDSQMMGEDHCVEILTTKCNSDYAIIEGVMGLFDGRSGVGQAGSSLDLARVTNSNILLCVNAKGMAGSIVPLVRGFVEEANKSGVAITGILANQVGSDHHLDLLTNLLTDNGLPPIVASLKKDAPTLPSRHLGLVEPEKDVPNFLPLLEVNEPALLKAFATSNKQDTKPAKGNSLQGLHLAISKDKAFNFIYQSNLDWLESEGAKVSFFSILKGDAIPKEAQALWLVGGYPELYSKEISTSKTLQSIKSFIHSGGYVLAECGGMMILGDELIDLEGKSWAMSKVLDFKVTMQKKLASLGYREDDSGLKGHEFHHSKRVPKESSSPAFNLSRGDQGIKHSNLTCSYVHWYFPSNPEEMKRIFNV